MPLARDSGSIPGECCDAIDSTQYAARFVPNGENLFFMFNHSKTMDAVGAQSDVLHDPIVMNTTKVYVSNQNFCPIFLPPLSNVYKISIQGSCLVPCVG